MAHRPRAIATMAIAGSSATRIRVGVCRRNRPVRRCSPVARSWMRSGGGWGVGPDLHLLVDGKRIDAIRRSDSEYAFRLTATPRHVRIRSRAAVPQEVGVERDERALGVALRRIVLAQPLRQRAIDAEDTSLTDGFHSFEGGHAFRWTNGDAAIPAELFAGAHGPCMLMLQLGATAE